MPEIDWNDGDYDTITAFLLQVQTVESDLLSREAFVECACYPDDIDADLLAWTFRHNIHCVWWAKYQETWRVGVTYSYISPLRCQDGPRVMYLPLNECEIDVAVAALQYVKHLIHWIIPSVLNGMKVHFNEWSGELALTMKEDEK